jgi:hypothetical protein
MCWLSIVTGCVVSLYGGPFRLFIKGRIGILGWCNFSCAFCVCGGVSFELNVLSFMYN